MLHGTKSVFILRLQKQYLELVGEAFDTDHGALPPECAVSLEELNTSAVRNEQTVKLVSIC